MYAGYIIPNIATKRLEKYPVPNITTANMKNVSTMYAGRIFTRLAALVSGPKSLK